MEDPFTPRLNEGPLTPKSDAGPLTPKLDINPVRPPDPASEMLDFVRSTFQQKEALRVAERSNPQKKQTVQSTFTSAPMQTLRSEAPLGRRVKDSVTVIGDGVYPPLTPRLRVVDGAYIVTITRGLVNERVPGEGDALIPQEIKGPVWGDSPSKPADRSATDPQEYTLALGDQISVVVYVTESGLLGGDGAPDGYVAEIVIEDENTESVHYAPPCGDDQDGTTGVYHYKLAVLRDADDDHSGPWIEKYLAGSHISHFRELPLIDNYVTSAADDLGRVVGKYDFTLNQYLFRGINSQYGITSIEDGTSISLSFDGTNIGGGLEILKLPTGDPPFANESAKHRTLRGLISSDAGFGTAAQITLSYADGDGSDVGANDAILVRGNSLNGENDAVTVEDGLVTVVKDFTSGGTDLPDGEQGDMLYWNVVDMVGSWTLLANPGAPSSPNIQLLAHDGNVPFWKDLTALEIDICESGTPTTVTVYKEP